MNNTIVRRRAVFRFRMVASFLENLLSRECEFGKPVRTKILGNSTKN